MAAAIGLRAWTLDANDYEDEASFRQAVVNELASSEYLSHRLGIAVVSAPIRREIAPDQWVTAGWTFRTATVPAVRLADTADLPTVAADVADAAAEVLDEADDEADDQPALEPEPADVSY